MLLLLFLLLTGCQAAADTKLDARVDTRLSADAELEAQMNARIEMAAAGLLTLVDKRVQTVQADFKEQMEQTVRQTVQGQNNRVQTTTTQNDPWSMRLSIAALALVAFNYPLSRWLRLLWQGRHAPERLVQRLVNGHNQDEARG